MLNTRRLAVVVSPIKSSIIFVVRTIEFRRYILAASLVGAVGLPSCNLVFTERGAGSSSDGPMSDGLVVDSQDRPSRINRSFTAPVDTRVTGGDPSLTFDETELWSVGGSLYDLQVAKQASATPQWSNDSAAVALLNTVPTNEIEPALTKDGRLLAFASNRTGLDKLYFAERTVTTLPFKTPTPNSIALPNPFLGFDMSPDGLKIYLVDGGMLKVMSRSSLTDAFGLKKVMVLPDANVRYPSVSFDELEILYSNNTGKLMHATLAANGNTYENPTVLAVGEDCNSVFEDVDLSADAMTVVYNCNGSLHIARRR